jgi:hypothetical protein
MANNVILRDDEIADLDPQKLEQAKKKFQQTSYEVARDITPITGELQSYKYALEDAADIAKAAKGQEGYEDMTPLEALGKVGMVGLGVLGTIPLVGYGPRLLRKGINSLMPKRGPRSNIPSDIDPNRSIDTFVREGLLTDPLYQYYVNNLPEYRRNLNDNINIREFVYMPRTEVDRLRNQMRQEQGLYETRMRILSEGPVVTGEDAAARSQRALEEVKQQKLKEERALENQTIKNNQKQYEVTVVKNSNALVSKNTDSYTFGRGPTAKPTGTVKDYLGSEAFDYVNQYGNSEATAEQWLGFLKGARQKGIKAEELEDSGILIFKGNDVVGGDLYEAVKKYPKKTFLKSEILSSLETNPAFRLKEKNYNFPLNSEELLNVVPNLGVLGEDFKRILTNHSFTLENVNARAPFESLNKDISSNLEDARSLLERFSASPNVANSMQKTINKIDSILPQLGDNDRLIARAYKEKLEEINALAKKGQEATVAPRHRRDFPEGGFDYREKVIYLNEAIPGNSQTRRAYSVHFDEPNVPVFVRYDTRGVDNYGDTLFIGEVQSDIHQTLTKEFGKAKLRFDKKLTNIDPDTAVRNNPYARKLNNAILKNDLKDILSQINALTAEHQVSPLSKSKMDQLMNLRKEYNTKAAETRVRPASVTTSAELYDASMSARDTQRGDSVFDLENKIYDYTPMPKEATWTQMAIKSMVNEARKRGQRYIALSPADFYHMNKEGKKNMLKIERFYGLSPRKIPGRPIEDVSKEFRGGPEAMGKYRDYSMDYEKNELKGTGKIKGTADMVKAMENVAKQIGAKTTIKRVYHTDSNKPYKLIYLKNRDSSSTMPEIPALAFKTKAEREAFLGSTNEVNFKKVDIKDVNDPRNYIESVVIDIQGAKKGPMKAYKLGGLVEVKRELFAPLF